jgi:hypothetical protein
MREAQMSLSQTVNFETVDKTDSASRTTTELADSKRISLSETTLMEDFELPDPSTIEHDQNWQHELTLCLGRLSIIRENFCKPTFVNELLPSLRATADVVNDLVMYVSQNVEFGPEDHCLPELLEHSAQYIAGVNKVSKSQTKSWFGFGNAKPQQISLSTCAFLFYDFVTILEQSFSALGNRFLDVEFKFQWIKTCGVFIAEIRNDLSWATELTQNPTT